MPKPVTAQKTITVTGPSPLEGRDDTRTEPNPLIGQSRQGGQAVAFDPG